MILEIPMKKVISVLLILCFVLSLCACTGGKGEVTTTEEPTVTATEPSSVVRVTFPEGYTLVRMAWRLEENGICSAEDFINEAQNGDFSSYPLVANEPDDEKICFKLEGYLFPCTIDVDKELDTPHSIIEKLLSAGETYITDEMRSRADELGYSMHDILTVASIVEKEAFTEDQKANIASVLYNRLDKGMQLQCDVTIKYVTGVIEEIYPEQVDTYKYFYNTYRCDALPAGPICNPGIESIRAALYPAESDYLFFAIQTEEPYDALFAADYNEHIENCKELGIY